MLYHQSKHTNSKQLTNKQTNLLIASITDTCHTKALKRYVIRVPFKNSIFDILLIFSNYVAVLSPKYKLLPIFVFIYLIINKSMSIHADLNRSSVFKSKQIGGFCLDTLYPLLAQKGG